MTLSTHQWHQRYQQQAQWTESLRKYLYDRTGIYHATRILDVGCGTGVILDELSFISTCSAYGVDLNRASISMAQGLTPRSMLTIGDALRLPYRSGSFEITLCHFLLLWVMNPLQSLTEMVRVVIPGGFVIALAEPDYGGRIDFPSELAQVGKWQIDALREQGANPFIGRELRSLFAAAGLQNIEIGILGGQWREDESEADIELEWQVIKSDLYEKKEFLQVAEELKATDLYSRKNHLRIEYVPTFYAVGEVKI
jgi:ubiquinone/menaquinone biosynthesis C-methylase UbiE